MNATETLVLATLRDTGVEMDRHSLYDAASRARKRAGARNSISYHHWTNALRRLTEMGLIEHRYAPSPYDDERKKFGRDYYRAVTS